MLRTHKFIQQLSLTSSIMYPMGSSELRELQLHLLGMLKDILEFCNNRNLRVMLAYGSALGAIRHQGFIPWDDDLDLMMPRADYEVFLKDFPSEFANKYKVMAPGLIGETKTNFAKVVDYNTRLIELMDINAPYPCGVFVDIFPIEHCPTNWLKNKTKRIISLGLMFICGSTAMWQFRNDVFKKFMRQDKRAYCNYMIRLSIGFAFSFLKHRTWCKCYDSFVRQENTTGQIHVPTAGAYDWKYMPVDMILPTHNVLFEGIEVPVPHKVHEYLQLRYGDYMQVPPENKRERHFVVEFEL